MGLGSCGVRWGYVLACVGFFDAIILGCLAHTLAGKKMKLLEEFSDPAYYHSRPGSMYKGEINPGFLGDNQSLAGSRKSVNLQPVMLMPHGHADMDRVLPTHGPGVTSPVQGSSSSAT